MADSYGAAGGGPQQIINGNYYSMYSPAWYAAMEAEKQRKATSAGTQVNNYADAANPALKGLQDSLTGMLSGSGAGGATGGTGNFTGGASTGSSVGTNGAGTSGVSGGAHLGTLQLPDQTASNNAIYAGAKDQVGKSSRASIDALRGELGATGNLGGGAEVQGVRDAVIAGQGQLGQVSRDLAVKNADMGADFAKTNFAGGITQRGQDVSASEAQARLAQEERLANASMAFQQQQANSARQMQMLQLAMSGLQGLSGGGTFTPSY